jgi:hypothetical protein
MFGILNEPYQFPIQFYGKIIIYFTVLSILMICLIRNKKYILFNIFFIKKKRDF